MRCLHFKPFFRQTLDISALSVRVTIFLKTLKSHLLDTLVLKKTSEMLVDILVAWWARAAYPRPVHTGHASLLPPKSDPDDVSDALL